MSGNDPLAVQDWPAYEKSMLDVLREERRSRIARGSGEARPAESEPPLQDAGPALKPAPAEPGGHDRDATETPEPGLSRQEPLESAPAGPSAAMPMQQSDEAPVPAPMMHVQSERRSRPTLRTVLVASSLAVILASVATVMLKSDRASTHLPQPAVSQEEAVAQKPSAADLNGVGGSQEIREVSRDRVRLRGAPAETAPILQTLRQGTSVVLKEHAASAEWCLVQAAHGPDGWMKCDFLKSRADSGADAVAQRPASGKQRK